MPAITPLRYPYAHTKPFKQHRNQKDRHRVACQHDRQGGAVRAGSGCRRA